MCSSDLPWNNEYDLLTTGLNSAGDEETGTGDWGRFCTFRHFLDAFRARENVSGRALRVGDVGGGERVAGGAHGGRVSGIYGGQDAGRVSGGGGARGGVEGAARERALGGDDFQLGRLDACGVDDFGG